MQLFSILWETFEEFLFPNAPALRERRQLRRLERQLRRSGVLAKAGRNLNNRWGKSMSDLNQALEPFRPLFTKTFGSPQVAYRQALSRRFWEESLGSEFLERRNQLTLEVLRRRFLQKGPDAAERQKIDREVAILLDMPTRADPVPLTQEWNALHWFAELVLFPFETILHPWSSGNKADPLPMLPALEDFYLVLGAVDPGKNLEHAVVRFMSIYIQDEAQIAKIYLQIQKVRALIFGPCHFSNLRDLLRWITEKPEAQPKIGRQDPQWFRRNSDDFEAQVRADLDKAAAEAFLTWIDNEVRALFASTPLLETPGYGEPENEILRKTKNPPFSLVRPLGVFKTYYFGVVRKTLVPLFRQILLKATFVDKELNKNLTQWVYRMEALEADWTRFEADLLDGPDSWGPFKVLLEKATVKTSPSTQRTVERINDKVFAFLTEKAQELTNLLEIGLMLEDDRRNGAGGIQNWKDLEGLEKDTEDTLGALPAQARAVFRLLKTFVPVHSSLLE